MIFFSGILQLQFVKPRPSIVKLMVSRCLKILLGLVADLLHQAESKVNDAS